MQNEQKTLAELVADLKKLLAETCQAKPKTEEINSAVSFNLFDLFGMPTQIPKEPLADHSGERLFDFIQGGRPHAR